MTPADPAGWRLVPSQRFARELRKLDREAAVRVSRSLAAVLATGDPRARGKALTGPLGGLWRYRVGDYRVLCEIRDRELVVLALTVGHRSKVYDDR